MLTVEQFKEMRKKQFPPYSNGKLKIFFRKELYNTKNLYPIYTPITRIQNINHKVYHYQKNPRSGVYVHKFNDNEGNKVQLFYLYWSDFYGDIVMPRDEHISKFIVISEEKLEEFLYSISKENKEILEANAMEEYKQKIWNFAKEHINEEEFKEINRVEFEKYTKCIMGSSSWYNYDILYEMSKLYIFELAMHLYEEWNKVKTNFNSDTEGEFFCEFINNCDFVLNLYEPFKKLVDIMDDMNKDGEDLPNGDCYCGSDISEADIEYKERILEYVKGL